MAQVSPAFRINGGAVGAAVSVAAGGAVVATIDSIAGISSVIWSIASTDETGLPGDYTLVHSGIKGEIVSTTALGAGTSAILRATINNGVDPTTGNNSEEMTATGKFWVPASANGFEVGCVNETFESNATFGSTGEVNAAIRNAAPVAGVPDTRQVIAGAGLTGGGALSGDVTINAVANADGSITVNADDLQVGILATDAQHGDRGGGGLHANVVAAGAAGFMTGADKTKLDNVGTSAPPGTRTITAGAGLTGGGDLSADRTIDVVANADGSITVNANDIQVGILATDVQHGNRAGGGLHANAIAAGAAGFMTGSDKAKLDGITAGAAVASVSGTPPIVSSGGTTPAVSITAATTIAAGSMSAADKTKLDGISATVGATNHIWGCASIAISGTTHPYPSYSNDAGSANEIQWTADKPFIATGIRYTARVGGSGAPTIDVAFRIAAVSTALAVNVAATATSGASSASVAVAAGDKVSIKIAPTGTLDTSPTDITITIGVTT